MILDVDIGNSSLKWRLKSMGSDSIDFSSISGGPGLDGKSIESDPIDPIDPIDLIDSGAARLDELDALQLNNAEVSRVRASCVAGAAFEQKFSRWCERQFGVLPEYARVRQACGGLTVAYRQPTALGVDRWLAMLAACHQVQGPCAVIDAGSALTVDFVNKEAMHLGGLILPGVRLMAEALFDRTHGVKVNALTLPQTWQPGCDTLGCVENAVAAALTGLVNEIIDYGEKHCGEGLALLVCGGDAEAVACRDRRFSIQPDLVLDGLPLALSSTFS